MHNRCTSPEEPNHPPKPPLNLTNTVMTILTSIIITRIVVGTATLISIIVTEIVIGAAILASIVGVAVLTSIVTGTATISTIMVVGRRNPLGLYFRYTSPSVVLGNLQKISFEGQPQFPLTQLPFCTGIKASKGGVKHIHSSSYQQVPWHCITLDN